LALDDTDFLKEQRVSSKFSIEESPTISGAKIKAIGVGGGGGNMINHMINQGIEGIDLIVANTDVQALDWVPV